MWNMLQEEERWAGGNSARTDVVRGSGTGDPTARAFDRLEILRSRYQEVCAKALAYAMRCEFVLAKLPNPAWEDVLRRRFIRDNSTCVVAQALGCSESKVRALVNQACAWLDERGAIDHVMSCDPFDDEGYVHYIEPPVTDVQCEQ